MKGGIQFTPDEVSNYYATRLPRLKQRGTEWRGPCPIHEGTGDNFAVDPATGKAFCHSQCGRGWDILALERELTSTDFKTALASVYEIIGRPPQDHFHQNGHINENKLTKGKSEQWWKWPVVAEYTYTDEAGKPLMLVKRHELNGEKQFGMHRPNGNGGWAPGIKDVRLVLYRLPALQNAQTVYLVEGEKCVHTLEALGLVATTSAMGAGKWREEYRYPEMLRGRSVVILPDQDGPGRKHAAEVAASLLDAAASVRIVELQGLLEKGDITDWVSAGGTPKELQRLAGEQPELTVEALAAWRVRWGLDNLQDGAARDPHGKAKGGLQPSPFRITDEAVFYCDSDADKELLICGRLEVAALTRDSNGDGWGRLLRWCDSEGRAHQWAMPMSLLAGDGNEYRMRLLDGGLFLATSRKAREVLTVYLQTVKPETRALCVARVGWHGDNFVLPGSTIGPEGAETVLFQTPFETDHCFNVSGTADNWRENVGRFCSGNSRLILAASCAFAGPLLSLVGGESGGVHFFGATSTGKSTALLVGGSVLGGGGRNGFVQSWRTTANGLEATAGLHNDLTLFLDELAQMDPREAGATAYLLGNGSGKARMSRNISARKKLSWSLLFVSAGEITLADHVQTAGKRIKGGAEVRLLNIDADAGAEMGLFENIHGAESPDAFARQLKDAAGRFYGAPLRTYLEFLTRNRAVTEKAIRNFQADFLKRYVPAGASGEVYRAADRFALIAAAGEIATTDAGITGWEQGESAEATARCLEDWLKLRGTKGAVDIEAAIRQVRNFIEVNGASRFQSAKERLDTLGNPIHEKVVNRAGFRAEEEETTTYLILPEVFRREVCEGSDYRTVAKVLAARGFLETQLPHLRKKCRLPEVGNIRVYAVRSTILEV